jgi:hypothetical protein
MVGGKSQKDAALYFGVTTRYIRKVLSSSLAVVDSSSQKNVAGTVSVAAPASADWVRLPGQRGLHRVAVTPHNQVEQPAKEEQPALVPTGTTVDRPVVATPATHNVNTVVLPVRVVRLPIEPQRADLFGWFLAASVGPVPLPAFLLALLLIVLCGVR